MRTCAISIHAPRTGSDLAGKRGEETSILFQSTLPARGATTVRGAIDEVYEFQSTLPARGATVRRVMSVPASTNFNPRSPHGERRNLHSILLSSVRAHFNPRSPHGERLDAALNEVGYLEFQSTLPARGATVLAAKFAVSHFISIHAPRTRSDTEVRTMELEYIISIHAPRTGSDPAASQSQPAASNFNPRSPHGERR